MLVATLISLVGSQWAPESDGNPDRYILFKENEVVGHAGCNRFFGHYTFDGNAIRIVPLATTRMACSPKVMDAEQAWLGMLQNARAAEVSPTNLVLKDENNAIIATLKRRE